VAAESTSYAKGCSVHIRIERGSPGDDEAQNASLAVAECLADRNMDWLAGRVGETQPNLQQ
jgi:hypothetical protein